MTIVRIVDDSREMAEMLRVLLEHEDLRVAVTCEDFPILLSPTLWEGVSVALVDLNLGFGQIHGVDVLGYLRENHPDIKRIVLTAASDKAPPVADTLGELADAVLSKPADLAHIVKAVKA